MKKTNPYLIKTYASKITAVRNLGQLCRLINTDIYHLRLQTINKQYVEYLKRERIDKFRLIEFPEEPLMKLLHTFNFYLQCAYYFQKTPSAYGFIINIKGEKHPRNILENAKRHLGNKYMLKADMKDFFHQIGKQRIYHIFKDKPFRYNSTTSQLLSNLFTYKERLPMGAPTSPVLSNFATIELDDKLNSWAINNNITYTRFADDMTFSSNQTEFTTSHLENIRQICSNNNFVLNETKNIFYSEKDEKTVTGLVLHEDIDIDKSFYDDLDKDLRRLKSMIEASIIVKQNDNDTIIKKYKQEVRGKINFIGMIEGYQSSEFFHYNQIMNEVLHPTEEKLFSRWTHFNYF